jgi:integrase
MGSVYTRRDSPFYWLKFRNAAGKKCQQKTSLVKGEPGHLEKAKELLALIERRVQAERSAAGGEVLTVARWSERWLKARREAGYAAVDDDETRLRHVLAHIGELPLKAVRAADIRDAFKAIMKSGLSPKSIHNVYGVTRTMFEEAVAGENKVLDANPCLLRVRRGELPEREDADPNWRPTAIYTRPEVEQLVSRPEVPHDRRVLYALLFFTGMRIGEVAARCWRDYDPTREPLGQLLVATAFRSSARLLAKTKTRRVRWAPVHPVLARVLAEWRLHGWAKMYGRQPGPADLIAPSLSRQKELRHRTNKQVLKHLHADLECLGLRERRTHDLRRTFVSLARADGAREDIVSLITHGPPKNVIADYTTLPWETMCESVSRLRVGLLEGQLLPLAAIPGGYAELRSSATTEDVDSIQRGVRDLNSSRGASPAAQAGETTGTSGSGSTGISGAEGADRSQTATPEEGDDGDPPIDGCHLREAGRLVKYIAVALVAFVLGACSEPGSGEALIEERPTGPRVYAHHDDARGATCWVVRDWALQAASISCLPDSALRPDGGAR